MQVGNLDFLKKEFAFLDPVRPADHQQPVRTATRLQHVQTVSGHVHPQRVHPDLSVQSVLQKIIRQEAIHC